MKALPTAIPEVLVPEAPCPTFIHTTHVQPLPGYRLHLVFNNGVHGEMNLSAELWGEMFEPLKDEALFASAHQDDAMGTVVWANGVDLAPEFLWDLMQSQAQQVA